MSSFSKDDDRCYHSLKILLLFLTTVLNKRCYIFAEGNERRLESKSWYFQSVSLTRPFAAVCSCFMFQLNGKNNLYTGRKSSLNRDISNKDLILFVNKKHGGKRQYNLRYRMWLAHNFSIFKSCQSFYFHFLCTRNNVFSFEVEFSVNNIQKISEENFAGV